MFRHRVSHVAAAALLLPGASCSLSASSPRNHRQGPKRQESGGGPVHRSLQTCTAADGFTVTSDAFPVMNGCYAEEEVPPNGGGNRLEVIRYSLSERTASFDVGSYNPFFGYKWLAIFHIDGTATGDSRVACQTNEEIGDLTPADPIFTWECDLDGDGTYETPTATDAMLSISCGCDSDSGETEPSPSPISLTNSPVGTTTTGPPVATVSPVSFTPGPTVIAATGTPIATTAPEFITAGPIVPSTTRTPLSTTAPAFMTPSPTATVATRTPSVIPTPITPSRTLTLAPVVPGPSDPAALATPVPTATSEPTAAATVSGSVVDPAFDSVCSNGLAGIEADEVCCDLSCGVCGGVGCGNVPGLTGDQCCVATIEATGDLCSMTGAAPCRVDPPEINPSTCPNGLPGVADGDACCAEACNGCGGLNCGIIAGTNGATDCCSGVILASGVLCDDSAAAPCIMTYDSGSSFQGPSGAGSGSESIFSMAPTPAAFTTPPTAGDGTRGGFFGSAAPTSAPTLSFTTATLSPTGASATLSPGGLGTTSPESATTTSAPVPVERGGDTSGAVGAQVLASSGLGGVVTLAAMIGGVFAVLVAARN